MGDNNVPSTLPNNATAAPGMEALMSAIEYHRSGGIVDPKLGGIIDPNLIESSRIYPGYPMMGSMQDHKAMASLHQNAENHLRSVSQAPSTSIYSTHLPFPSAGIAVNPGTLPPFIHPMLMPFMQQGLPGLRPNASNQANSSLPMNAFPSLWGVRASNSEQILADQASKESPVYKCTLCGAVCSDARELHAHLIQEHTGVQSHPGSLQDKAMAERHDTPSHRPEILHEKWKGDPSATHKSTDMYNPSYPQIPHMHQAGLSSDKLASMQEAAAKSLQYVSTSAMNPFLGLRSYPNLIAANAAGLMPAHMLNSAWNPALRPMGFPYYQNSLLQRMPYLSQFGQNSMIRMSMNAGVNKPPSQPPEMAPTSESNKPPAAPRLDPSRPQSGGYLPVKESLQRRLSAPVIVSGSPSRLPLSMRGMDMGKVNPNYPSFSQTYSPSQMISQPPDNNKPGSSISGGKAGIDAKSIEQHISKLISHNEKILLNPTLDRVKPRRVFRRNSLDPASLSSNPAHNPLTATYSAPRCLDATYQKSEEEKHEMHNFLTVPSRLTDPHLPLNDSGGKNIQYGQYTKIPDPRRDPNLCQFSEMELREYRKMAEHSRPSGGQSSSYDNVNERAKAVTQGLYQQAALGKRLSTGSIHEGVRQKKENAYQCFDCGIEFAVEENYITHRSMYCLKRASQAASSQRQSVIQHTGIQADSQDVSNLPKSVIPQVNITPPDESRNNTRKDKILPITNFKREELLMNPLRFIHKDLCRTRSADAALQISTKARDIGLPIANSPLSDIGTIGKEEVRFKQPIPSPKPEGNDSPSKSEASHHLAVCSITKSSIPTDKLPPKKKQLQLMRTNSTNQSYLDSRSPSHSNPSPQTPETSPKDRKTPEVEQSAHPTTENLPLAPFVSIIPTSASMRKSLPPWIPLEQDENQEGTSPQPPGTLAPAPTILLPQVSATSPSSPQYLVQNTQVKSPTSPSRSPTRRRSPGRSPSRSPSRSPTSSNLESTIPRSNYKLLLHQISLRNMKDLGYLSEAYHNSKDKNLKRNIASLLWSSDSAHVSSGVTSPKRTRQFSSDSSKMEELFPGKASLARRLSPNIDRTSNSYESNDYPRNPLSHTLSRQLDDNSEAYRLSVTRSHSAGTNIDVNNNIKQFLQNKNKNQQALTSPSKTHRPLRRLNANARYLLKSPTRMSPTPVEPVISRPPSEIGAGMDGQDHQKTPATRTLSTSWAGEQTRDTLSLKRAKSYNPETAMDYQSKRQRLFPISQQTTQALPASALPPKSVALRFSEHQSQLPSQSKEASHKVNEAEVARASTLLYPHLTPKLGYEPHPTFCSLLSPQPMYVELQQSVLSMYSQWAVSEPLLLPEGLTVMDLLNNMKTMKGLSPYISYGSLFMNSTSKENLKVTDTKEYEALAKEAENKSDLEKSKSENSLSVDDAREQNKKDEKHEETKEMRDWMMSRMPESRLISSKTCFTSCHDRNLFQTKTNNKTIDSKDKEYRCVKEEKMENDKTKNISPKIQLPKVIIHPPSPPRPNSNDDMNPSTPDSKNQEITALEFSDCDTDDTLTEQLSPTNHFLTYKKGASPDARATPPSDCSTNCDTVTNIASPDSESSLAPPRCSNTSPQPMEVEPIHSEAKTDEKVENIEIITKEKESNEIPDVNVNKSMEKCENMEIEEKGHNESANSLEEGVKVRSSGSDKEESQRKKNKKVRKTRRERNAMSPRLQKKMNQQFPESPSSHTYEDPSLAVHPTGACRGLSDDPSRTCALCSMKAGGPSTQCSKISQHSSSANASDDGKCEVTPSTDEKSTSNDTEAPICKHVHSPPLDVSASSPRPKTPVPPLTVTVPMRNRDRSSTKSSKQPLAPGILDKARGKGTTQHWVTTSDLQATSPSPTLTVSECSKNEDKIPENNKIHEIEKVISKISEYDKVFQNSEFNSMPPNQNPVLKLNLQKVGEQTQVTSPVTTGGQASLAAVVSGVIRSAAIQSKKKTKSSKLGMNELLSHSRPLIPTSELNGSAASSHARLSEKLNENRDKSKDTVVAITTGVTTPSSSLKYSKVSSRHLALSTRESELFLNKTNETASVTDSAMKGSEETSLDTEEEAKPSEHDTASSEVNDEQMNHDGEESAHSDDAKDDSMHEGDGESSNPRPHKCAECKVAFRIAGHLAKHLRSKGHIIAMQKKTLNRLKQQQQKLSSVQDTVSNGVQGVNCSTSAISPAQNAELAQQQALYSQLEAGKYTNQEEILNQLVEGAEPLARAQVRALFEGNDEYTEIVAQAASSGSNPGSSAEMGVSDLGEEGGEKFTHLSLLSQQPGCLDPRPFKCIACKVAFRFQGHLDRHFRSNMHLLAVGHFEKDKVTTSIGLHIANTHFIHGDTQDDNSHPGMGGDSLYTNSSPKYDENYGGVITEIEGAKVPILEDPQTEEMGPKLENGVFPESSSENIDPETSESQEIEEMQETEEVDPSKEVLELVESGEKQKIRNESENLNDSGFASFRERYSSSGPEPPCVNGPMDHENSTFNDSNAFHNNKVEDTSPGNEMDAPTPNKQTMDSDSPKEMSIILNSASKIPKEPINGITPHIIKSVPSVIGSSTSNGIEASTSLFPISPEKGKTPPINNEFKNLKQRLSPVIQSNSKPIFEAPPSLPDGPIATNSSVHSRQQQLTC